MINIDNIFCLRKTYFMMFPIEMGIWGNTLLLDPKILWVEEIT